MYSITCPLILITSPASILNLPINSFCPLDTALVLTSDNFHLIFPPFPPLSPTFLSHNLLVAPFKNSHMMPLRETSVIIKIFWISIHVFYVHFLQRSLQFSVRVFPFPSYILWKIKKKNNVWNRIWTWISSLTCWFCNLGY